jgi:hypothetical protein
MSKPTTSTVVQNLVDLAAIVGSPTTAATLVLLRAVVRALVSSLLRARQAAEGSTRMVARGSELGSEPLSVHEVRLREAFATVLASTYVATDGPSSMQIPVTAAVSQFESSGALHALDRLVALAELLRDMPSGERASTMETIEAARVLGSLPRDHAARGTTLCPLCAAVHAPHSAGERRSGLCADCWDTRSSLLERALSGLASNGPADPYPAPRELVGYVSELTAACLARVSSSGELEGDDEKGGAK